MAKWYEKHLRRILVDMHIQDWDPSFLGEVSPEEYVELMVRGNATAAMVYANSHVGLCYWPTRTGKMHGGLNGRDFFGQVLKLCREQGLAFEAYYSLIYNNWAFVNYPEWRMQPLTNSGLPRSRYGWCCPNSSGYREFVTAQIEELFSEYRCDGVFFDMTFWPDVCYCPDCVARYRLEKGVDPPREVDWSSPAWFEFLRWREDCIYEFGAFATAEARRVQPGITVTHNFATVLAGPMLGEPFRMFENCDYLSGDFYGDPMQQSVVCKTFHALSKSRPFEFHTSRCLGLYDHVTLKTSENLASCAFLAPAHAAAFMFIDAIDPVGTMCAPIYPVLGSIFGRMAEYEPYSGGNLVADVAVFFSNESKFDPDSTEKRLRWGSSMPHWNAVLGACSMLKESHIPFGVVTKHNLPDLARYQVLVLPDVLVMSDDEVAAVRSFVKKGGGVYASCRTSARGADGTRQDDFMLADVLGVSFDGDRPEKLSFLSAGDDTCKRWFDPQEHMIHNGPVERVRPGDAQVRATLTLPYTDPNGGELFGPTFVSIHSNPPGPTGTDPALLSHSYGSGKAFYCVAALEAVDNPVNGRVFTHIIRELLSRPTCFEADIHPCIEVVVLDQPKNRRMLVSFVSAQAQAPNIPVTGTCRVRAPEGCTPTGLVRLPDESPVEFTVTDKGYAEFLVENIEVFEQFMLSYA